MSVPSFPYPFSVARALDFLPVVQLPIPNSISKKTALGLDDHVTRETKKRYSKDKRNERKGDPVEELKGGGSESKGHQNPENTAHVRFRCQKRIMNLVVCGQR